MYISENNLFYRVDLGFGPTNWSDGGIASGAENKPKSPKDDSSFTFRRNIVVVQSGAMFSATTANGYRHMSFAQNVYYDLSGMPARVGFPCDPAANATWISAPNCLVAAPAQTIQSSNGQVSIGFNSTGYFVLNHRSL
eukprot:SAG31_NODE_855_length_11461_cov_5.496215_6_plen_138_part_00